MTPSFRRRARWERLRRNAYYELVGLVRSVTFPVRRPKVWLQAKYFRLFYFFYYGGQENLAFRFGRIWPRGLGLVVDFLRERQHRFQLLAA